MFYNWNKTINNLNRRKKTIRYSHWIKLYLSYSRFIYSISLFLRSIFKQDLLYLRMV